MIGLPLVASLVTTVMASPIIGGQGAFKYQYMPDRLQPPAGAKMVNCHGLVLDNDSNIYLTYQNDGKTDQNCLIKWKPDGTSAEWMTGGGTALCAGTPHGLKIALEKGTQYLYHANNDQKLTKTHLDGTIVWQINGTFGQDPKNPYRPTWFAIVPDSEYVYLCDGYGSNNIYPFHIDGTFMNITYGGKGGRDQHGKFSTNHGCTWDPRKGLIGVSDRANSRIEYFEVDPESPNKFEYKTTFDLRPSQGDGTLPCNIRIYPEQESRAIIPDLAGPVQVLDRHDNVISVVDVSGLLGETEGTKHPHDAIFLPNGDMVVAAWNPGRLTYWRRLPAELVVVV
eukprot:TRINITY_DN28818_c0_g1_i1.p1 TRINITY_DN28818_c0_g1~~TRINITY_DN28818_c0_g1_i1.p1  ORF type:complete len:362 (-),score=46.83 TRINITY_DN28818_c0_g1_i1:367-1380(-)